MSTLQQLNTDLDEETARIWLEEPYEISLIRNGIILTGAGSNGQYYSVLVHLEGFLMYLAPHVIYRLLVLARDPNIDLYSIRETTITMLSRPFDQFKLLGDLGLRSAETLGTRYVSAIGTVSTHAEYVELTARFFTYLNRLYQWVHFIFPWSIGASFPKQHPDDISQQLQAIESWRIDTDSWHLAPENRRPTRVRNTDDVTS